MRKALCMFAMSIVMAVSVFAGSYSVSVSSQPVLGSASEFVLGGYPNLKGVRDIEKLSLYNTGAVDQTVLIYQNAASSMTAITIAYRLIVPSTATVAVPLVEIFGGTPLRLKDIAIMKSSEDSNVYLNVVFK